MAETDKKGRRLHSLESLLADRQTLSGDEAASRLAAIFGLMER